MGNETPCSNRITSLLSHILHITLLSKIKKLMSKIEGRPGDISCYLSFPSNLDEMRSNKSYPQTAHKCILGHDSKNRPGDLTSNI